jgi:hypothetical protein
MKTATLAMSLSCWMAALAFGVAATLAGSPLLLAASACWSALAIRTALKD